MSANAPKAKAPLDWIDWIAIALALVITAAGITRIVKLDLPEGLDETTLLYFVTAAVLLLLRRLKSFSFGDYSAEFESLRAGMNEAKEDAVEAIAEAKTAASMARHMGPTEPAPAIAAFAAAERPTSGSDTRPLQRNPNLWDASPGKADDDPWKGVFGDAEHNNRRLTAKVTPIKDEEHWFRIHLVVVSTDRNKHPLAGRVRFFLHDSFPNPKPFVDVVDGVAELRLNAWGAFTVGVIADDGATRLELDLAQDTSFPALFRRS